MLRKELTNILFPILGKFLFFTEKDGCWYCVSHAAEASGYNYIKVGKVKEGLHRLVYMHTKGVIPDGQMVIHSCDNKKCCNPEHLSTGSGSDNMQDSISRNRFPRGVNSVCAKLTTQDVLDIRKSTSSMKRLAKIYGVGTTTIFRVKHEITYFTTREGEYDAVVQ